MNSVEIETMKPKEKTCCGGEMSVSKGVGVIIILQTILSTLDVIVMSLIFSTRTNFCEYVIGGKNYFVIFRDIGTLIFCVVLYYGYRKRNYDFCKYWLIWNCFIIMMNTAVDIVLCILLGYKSCWKSTFFVSFDAVVYFTVGMQFVNVVLRFMDQLMATNNNTNYSTTV